MSKHLQTSLACELAVLGGSFFLIVWATSREDSSECRFRQMGEHRLYTAKILQPCSFATKSLRHTAVSGFHLGSSAKPPGLEDAIVPFDITPSDCDVRHLSWRAKCACCRCFCVSVLTVVQRLWKRSASLTSKELRYMFTSTKKKKIVLHYNRSFKVSSEVSIAFRLSCVSSARRFWSV